LLTKSIEPSASTEPSCKAGHLDAEIADEAHVVLDDDDRAGLGDLLEQDGGLGRLASVMPATGSSTSSSLGSCASSMPISSHCFWPCERLAGEIVLARRHAHRFEDLLDTRLVGRCQAVEQRRKRPRVSDIERQFRYCPQTVWLSNTVGFWNLRPMPSWAISASSSLVRSTIAVEEHLPLSGRVLPVMMSIIVVLPAPFGPMMARSSPGSTTKRQRVQRLEAVERDRNAVEIEQAAGGLFIHRFYSAAWGFSVAS
jgi:hypothetical protein